MWVWYRGDRFNGFQWQPVGRSVQAELERALRPLGVKSRPMASGRTDKGVHARMQVVQVSSSLAPAELAERANAQLGPDAGIALAKRPHPSFHPQWSSSGKEYRYRLWLAEGPAPELCWAPSREERFSGARVSLEVLRECFARAEGTRDYSAFSPEGLPAKERTIESALVIEREDGSVDVRLRGSGFAKFQVRIMVGTAALVAAGLEPLSSWDEALAGKRRIAGVRAPGEALVLWEVRYPKALDPFSEEERAEARGVPRAPPFTD